MSSVNIAPGERSNSTGSFAVNMDAVIEQNIGVVSTTGHGPPSSQSALRQSAAQSANEILNGSSMHSIYDDIHAVSSIEKFEDEGGFIASILPRTTRGPSGQVFYYVRNPKRFNRCLIFLVALAVLVITLSVTLPKLKHKRASGSSLNAPAPTPPPFVVFSDRPTVAQTPFPVDVIFSDSPTPATQTQSPVDVVFSDSPTPVPQIVTQSPVAAPKTPSPVNMIASDSPTPVPATSSPVAVRPETPEDEPPVVPDPEQECNIDETQRDVDPFLQCYCNDFNGFTHAWTQQVVDLKENLQSSMPDINPEIGEGLTANSCHPQNMALYWTALDILNHESLSADDTMRVQQRYILAHLYGSWDGDDWENFEGWLDGVSECQWYGVACNDNLEISVLQLENNGMEGPMPRPIGFLTSLTSLDLSSNYVYGELPNDFFFLTNLEKVDLSDNGLEGNLPEQLVTFENLDYLSLAKNNFTGPLSTTYGSTLSKLAHLDVSSNILTGTIPSELFGMRQLTSLMLGENEGIGGTVPKEVDFLQKLQVLSLKSMNLEGSLPPTLGLIRSLEELRLDQNDFAGTIPAVFGDLKELTFLDLENNQLQGSIPTQLGLLSNLELISLSDNVGIFGPIPQQMSSYTSLISGHFSNMPLLTGTAPFCDVSIGEFPQYLVMDCTPNVLCTCCTSNKVTTCDMPKSERGNMLRGL
uniref:Leucine-rich repeat-containing N-terminal plant-type domain-containing protein n=1 Tax=Grammatophora oceanica TaxID=210454 RepID=A0A7S1V5A0_9STRA|mmetsp:Transcript_35459/g.52787  ORF Transcript_35459/g.52787 Transcript_35459/m.52787 type:complete len:696 (+) Transcript_35459:154-2241(+)|eukprot:CAMPEP_0194049552 /NCGR_PEP_ID=MMETSP0009_2-20130614/30747_1 /TAXON_ID=210454 /ORGANISM="Grammatophora oceanica, Strain CCMP 410" /LENGTH=695 /DNA_ID=CAMNT_0038695737 /DNA_START=101 /DNA_END=2188 /DNA_ORIENTATION=+